jgi:hypothetical protein
MRFRFVLSFALAAFTAVAAPSVARAADAPDLVKLKDGSMYRGTIAELVAGDHVVITLATGETKRFAMADVASAGPAPTAPPVAPPAPPPPPPASSTGAASLALTANTDDVTFSIKTGEAEFSGAGFAGGRAVYVSGTADAYSTICTAPCTTSLTLGTHRMGLTQGGGHVVPAEEAVTITGPGKLEGTYTSRLGVRAAGLVVLIAGVGGGTALMLAGMKADHHCDPSVIQGEAPFCYDRADTTMLGEGLGISLVGTLVGWILLSVRDGATIDFTPSASALVKPREGVGFDGRGLVVRF